MSTWSPYDPYNQAWLSRLPRYGAGYSGGAPAFPTYPRRRPPEEDPNNIYSAIAGAIGKGVGVAGDVLHTALAPIGVAKQGVDWLTRTGARELYGLELPETATAEGVLRDVLLPADASRGSLGALPDAWLKSGALAAARAVGVDEDVLRTVQGQPTIEDFVFGSAPKGVLETGTRTQQAQQLARSGAGAIGEFVSGLALDPMMYVLPGAMKGATGRSTAQKILGKGGPAAVPGVRQYAPEVAKALESAVGTTGPGRMTRAVSRGLGIKPDQTLVEKFVKAGYDPMRAEAMASGQKLMRMGTGKYSKYVGLDPARAGAEKALHLGFTAQMGLGGLQGMWEAAKQTYEAGKLTPEALEAGVHGLASGAMAGMGVLGSKRKALQAKEALALGKEILPGYPISGGKRQPLPIDMIPDPLQRKAEGYASSLAEKILKEGEETGKARLQELPVELDRKLTVDGQEKTLRDLIWDQAMQEAQAQKGGQILFDRLSQEHPEGKPGVEVVAGPDGESRVLLRGKKGDLIGVAQLGRNPETGVQELGSIAGGRALGKKESIVPLYEKLTEMGVERKEKQLTALGALARRRGAERLYPREVLEGRKRSDPAKEVREATETFIEEGLEDVMALPSRYATGKPAYAAEGKPFFSQLRKVVDAPKTQGKMPADQWAKFLRDPKRQIKADEMKWSGLDDYLAGRKGERVTREEIQKYLDENEVRVEDVTKGQGRSVEELQLEVDAYTAEGQRFQREIQHLEAMPEYHESQRSIFNAPPGEYTPELRAERLRRHEAKIKERRDLAEESFQKAERATELMEATDLGQAGHVKFAEYTLPGGENYREVLLTKPDVSLSKAERAEYNALRGKMGSDEATRSELRRWDALIEKQGRSRFKGGHFEEPNVLAHVRLNDRVGPKGEKILFVEEIQSDWAQKGRREGFKGAVDDAEVRAAAERASADLRAAEEAYFADSTNPELQQVRDRARVVRDDAMRMLDSARSGVPTAPFVEKTGDWSNLAMKRVMKMAADEGYDKVAWTRGEQQAARYDLARHVDEVIINRHTADGGGFQVKAMKDGEVVIPLRDAKTAKDLVEIVGKDLADKAARLGPKEEQTFSGLDLQVGGEGMKGFYDKILPGVASKLGKKFGAKVGETEIAARPEGAPDLTRKYEGPSFTWEQLREFAKTSERPLIEKQAKRVAERMEGTGESFEAAMKGYGSPVLAEALGGKLADVRIPGERVHSIDITPQMRETVKREGFPLFKAEVEAAKTAEPLPMKDFLLKVYPEDSVIRVKGDKAYEVELPDGRSVKWNLGKDHIEIDLEAFEEAYRRKPLPGEEAKGVTYRMPNEAVVDIVEGAEAGIPIHEHWHVLKHMGVLNEGQLKSLKKKFATEELEADAFSEWLQKRTPNNVFERIWDGIKALYQQVTGAPEAVFRAAERGEPLTREVAAPRVEQMKQGVFAEAADETAFEAAVEGALTREPGPPRLVLPKKFDAALKTRGVTATEGAVAAGEPLGPQPKYSVRTVEETKAGIRALNKKTGWFTEPQMEKYFRDMDNVTDVVLKNRERLDYTPAAHLRAVKKNSDPHYERSVDFTTMCKKRYRMQATIDEAQRRLKRPLTSDEVMEIRAALKERGVDTSCGACYVDSRRINMATVIDKATKGYRITSGENKGKRVPPLPKKVHPLLLTTEGLRELAEKYPEENAKFRKLFAGLNMKIPEARTEYRGEIAKGGAKVSEGGISDRMVGLMNERSGLRWQSWSDFEVPHLLDGMQVIGDMSQRGLKGHVYTKVPELVQAFGPTGMMINMSLIPKGTGLSKGKLVFDETQSFPLAEGRRLRKKYDNAGFEAIGVNDAQIRLMLEDPNIDYVIPYHASGLSKRYQKMVGMEGWKDYEHEQQFRDVKTGKAVDEGIYWNEFEGDMAKFDALLKERELTPPFARMREWPGYEKLLTDRRIYGNDGKYITQQVVQPTFDMKAINRIMKEYGGEETPFVPEVVDRVVAPKPKGKPAYATARAPEPELPMGQPKPPGKPPRVEERVEKLGDAIKEQKKLGLQQKELVLAREHRRNWEALDPEVREKITEWDDTKMLKAMERRTLDDVEVMALDAVVRGRREAKELARMEFLEKKGTNEESGAWQRYAKALADYVPLERANVNDGTGTARALAARARLMEAAETPDRTFLKKVMRELPGVGDKDAESLVRMFETGDPRLADALRAATTGRWKQWQTLLRAMLITPSSEIPNLLGNSIVQGVEVVDAGFASGIDWFASKVRGRNRERYVGELGAEISGWGEALPAAMTEFLKERFSGIYKRAWTGESKIDLERRLEYQVSPFKGKTGRLITTSLDALAAGDHLFRTPLARGELKKRAYRLARKQAKKGASTEEIAVRADEIAFEALNKPELHQKMLNDIKASVSRRLFQGKPWKVVDHLRSMERDWPWIAAALPFVRTPANIARYAIHHSPMGMLTPEFGRALRVLASGKEQPYQRGGKQYKMGQGEAADVVSRRITGTAIFAMAGLAAKSGKLTGSGPSDWNEQKALKETGWRPYSFVATIDGKKVYIPFARFDPVSQVMGVAADVAEMGETRDANDLASKAIGSIAENFTDRTYLKGLIDFTEALNDPVRFAGNYAIGIGTMHIPRQIGRIATAIDPVMRDVRPLDRSLAGYPKKLRNSVIRNIPWLSKTLPARVGPTGEEIVRPGKGVSGALMRTVSPIQVSPERPGRELEALMAKIGYVPGEPKPYMTVQGEQILLDREDLALLQRADRNAAYELRRIMQSPLFSRLPETIEEGGSNSQEGYIRKTYQKYRDMARQQTLRSVRFRRKAMEQLRERRGTA